MAIPLSEEQVESFRNVLNPDVELVVSRVELSYGLQQLIITATRVTDKTNTLIDVIITNSPHCDIKTAGVTRSGISDHDIIFAVRKIKKSYQPAFETREVRNFKDVNIFAAQNMIHQSPWWCLRLSEDIDNKFELYCEIIKIIMNTHIPTKKLRVKT
jgi:hypothetical protein